MRGTLGGAVLDRPAGRRVRRPQRRRTPGDFTVFAPAAPVPHRLYLGHAALFSLTGTAEIELSLSFGATRPAVCSVQGNDRCCSNGSI